MSKSVWPTGPLGSVATVGSGYAFKSSEFRETGIPVIKIKNIRVGVVDLTEVDRVDEKFRSLPERYQVRAGDVLISLTGSHISQPNSVVGRVARHGANLPQCLLNQRGGKVMIKDQRVCDLGFLFYALSERDTVRAIALKAHGAANQANVSPTQVESVEVPIPSLVVQRRVAGILSAYDQLIANCQRRSSILEEMMRALYREWLLRAVPPSEGDAKGLERRKPTLADLCKLVKTPFDESVHATLPLIDLSRIPQHSIAPADVGDPSELTSARIIFEPGDTLFGAIRCYLHKVVVAHYPGVTNTSVLVLRPKRARFRTLVAIIASDVETIRWADSRSSGTKMPVINWTVFQTMPVPSPVDELAERFEKAAGSMLDQIGVLAEKIQNLRRARDLLLPRLLSGQVSFDVSAAEGVAEPAAHPPSLSYTDFATEEPALRAAEEAPPCRVEHARHGLPPPVEPADEAPVSIDQIDRTEVLQVIRQVFSEGPPRERDAAIRDVARALGYRRTGPRIQEILHTDLMTAVRRCILENENSALRLCARSIKDYDRDFLKQQFLAAIGRTWIDRDTAIRDFCRWLGFARTGPIIEDTACSLINGLLREGRMEAAPSNEIRRI